MQVCTLVYIVRTEKFKNTGGETEQWYVVI